MAARMRLATWIDTYVPAEARNYAERVTRLDPEGINLYGVTKWQPVVIAMQTEVPAREIVITDTTPRPGSTPETCSRDSPARHVRRLGRGLSRGSQGKRIVPERWLPAVVGVRRRRRAIRTTSTRDRPDRRPSAGTRISAEGLASACRSSYGGFMETEHVYDNYEISRRHRIDDAGVPEDAGASIVACDDGVAGFCAAAPRHGTVKALHDRGCRTGEIRRQVLFGINRVNHEPLCMRQAAKAAAYAALSTARRPSDGDRPMGTRRPSPKRGPVTDAIAQAAGRNAVPAGTEP